MTEAEWLTATYPTPMLVFLEEKASDRKLQLFACNCCRRIWPYLHSPNSRNLIEILESVIEGLRESDELAAARLEAQAYLDSDDCRRTESGCSAAYAADSATKSYPNEKEVWVASRTADCVQNTFYWVAYESNESEYGNEEQTELVAKASENSEALRQALLLRDIFGNPFRPVTVNPAWLTSDVVAMCRGMYESRDFAAMPILADALQDAGCENDDILTHCRGDGPHVRGCWVVDLMLGKE